MKDSDTWKTPTWLMESIKGYVDRCPPDYQLDALSSEWTEDSYVNPPYSNPLPFVQKALEQHKKHGIKVMLLLKMDSSTKWYKALVEGGGAFPVLCREAPLFGKQGMRQLFERVMYIE